MDENKHPGWHLLRGGRPTSKAQPVEVMCPGCGKTLELAHSVQDCLLDLQRQQTRKLRRVHRQLELLHGKLEAANRRLPDRGVLDAALGLLAETLTLLDEGTAEPE